MLSFFVDNYETRHFQITFFSNEETATSGFYRVKN